jgi:hypothetical protein
MSISQRLAVGLLIFELAVQLLTRGWSSPVVVVAVANISSAAVLVHQPLVAMEHQLEARLLAAMVLAVRVAHKLLVAPADHVVQVVLPMDQVELQVYLAKVALLVQKPEQVALEAVAVAVAVITAVVVAEWNATPDQVVAVQAGLIHHS